MFTLHEQHHALIVADLRDVNLSRESKVKLNVWRQTIDSIWDVYRGEISTVYLTTESRLELSQDIVSEAADKAYHVFIDDDGTRTAYGPDDEIPEEKPVMVGGAKVTSFFDDHTQKTIDISDADGELDYLDVRLYI